VFHHFIPWGYHRPSRQFFGTLVRLGFIVLLVSAFPP